MSNPIVFLEYEIGGKYAGRIHIELFADVVPRTAEVSLSFMIFHFCISMKNVVNCIGMEVIFAIPIFCDKNLLYLFHSNNVKMCRLINDAYIISIIQNIDYE